MKINTTDVISLGRQRASRRSFLATLGGGLLLSTQVRADTPAEIERSQALAELIFPGQELLDGSALLTVYAPARAEDSAIVPITLRTSLASDDPRLVRKITLIIEANPSPLAAVFSLAEGSGTTMLSTRVRINDFTNIRAVAELSDGKLYTAARYVKAAGGCSAPVLRMTDNSNELGSLRFREFPVGGESTGTGHHVQVSEFPAAAGSSGPGQREVQVMVRHPNFSGMQLDQISRSYIPAEFLQQVRVWQGDNELLSIESGISISENPSFRFNFQEGTAKTFRVDAADSEGRRFTATFPADSNT